MPDPESNGYPSFELTRFAPIRPSGVFSFRFMMSILWFSSPTASTLHLAPGSAFRGHFRPTIFPKNRLLSAELYSREG